MAKKSNTPLISIVLPVYNAAEYLAETLDSIVRQTFRDYELLAVNDGSTDGSQDILEAYAKRDDRIVVIQQKNKGLVTTLNETIAKAKGAYIARADADDPSFEDRLALQSSILQKNEDIVLVGGGFEIIDESGFFIETVCGLTRDEDIRRAMLVRNPFGHAGVMFRKSAFEKAGGYSGTCGPTEDFDLWIRISMQGELASIARPAYRYRIVSSGISQTKSAEQAHYTKKLTDAQWKAAFPSTLSRRTLQKRSEECLQSSPRLSYAIGLKEQFLTDNARIGMKLIRYGKPVKGIIQLISICSTGRSGVRIVIRQLRNLDAGSFKQLTKRS